MAQPYGSYIESEEETNWGACFAAGKEMGYVPKECEICDSGHLGCNGCPWQELPPYVVAEFDLDDDGMTTGPPLAVLYTTQEYYDAVAYARSCDRPCVDIVRSGRLVSWVPIYGRW